MIVVDASYFIDALVGSEERARAALDVLLVEPDVGAPDFVDAEVANGLRGQWLGHRISNAELATAMEVFGHLAVVRHPSRLLVHRALMLRQNATAYDGCYISLAESLEVPLYTADAKLKRVPGIRCEVRVLGEAA